MPMSQAQQQERAALLAAWMAWVLMGPMPADDAAECGQRVALGIVANELAALTGAVYADCAGPDGPQQ